MANYLIKRLLLVLPTLFGIMLIRMTLQRISTSICFSEN